jgi:hypothetical protein
MSSLSLLRISLVCSIAVCAIVPLAAVGCSQPDDHAAHAHGDVTPGSHADWCGEHAVPESLCTRCNPDLVPAFRATGDWCEEHALPESQCLRCNPELVITRPPADDEH